MEKKELKQMIKIDKSFYKNNNSFVKRIYNFIIKHNDYYIYKTIIFSRLYSFSKSNKCSFLKKYITGKSFLNIQDYLIVKFIQIR